MVFSLKEFQIQLKPQIEVSLCHLNYLLIIHLIAIYNRNILRFSDSPLDDTIFIFDWHSLESIYFGIKIKSRAEQKFELKSENHKIYRHLSVNVTSQWNGGRKANQKQYILGDVVVFFLSREYHSKINMEAIQNARKFWFCTSISMYHLIYQTE